MTTGRREIWLRGNRRVYATVLFPTLLILIGSTMIISGTVLEPPFWLKMVAAGISGFAAVVTVSLIYWFQRPLLAYQNGFLLVYLSPPAVNRVPIEFVEVFFAGQSDIPVPRSLSTPADPPPESRNIVVRLAESATDFHQRPVKMSLGSWKEGYIVVRGTWAEPITKGVFKRLNRRLVEVHRQQQSTQDNQCREIQPACQDPLTPVSGQSSDDQPTTIS